MSRSLAALVATATVAGALAVSGGVGVGGGLAGPGPASEVGSGGRADAATLAGAGAAVGANVAGGPAAAGVTRARAAPDPGAAALRFATPGVAPAHRWRWPLVPRPPVLRRFRAPPDPYAAGHRGLDLATRVGEPVLAVAEGRVTHSGLVAGRGTITVLHEGGLRSTYEPVDPSVSRGDAVEAGEPMGVVAAVSGSASSHCGARTCLHLGARRDQAYVDPWPLLTGGRLALLPVG